MRKSSVVGLAILLLSIPLMRAQESSSQDHGAAHVAISGHNIQLQHAGTVTCPAGAEHLKHAVTLLVYVDATGKVTGAKVISAKPSAVDAAAVDAVKASTFSPVLRNGKPESGRKIVWVMFRGDGSPGVTADKVDQPPVPLVTPQAMYTKQAEEKHFTGEVMVFALVGEDGKVTDAGALTSAPYGMDAKAVQAVQQYRFSPARKNGQPVAEMITIAINFRQY